MGPWFPWGLAAGSEGRLPQLGVPNPRRSYCHKEGARRVSAGPVDWHLIKSRRTAKLSCAPGDPTTPGVSPGRGRQGSRSVTHSPRLAGCS